jgi:hypothetical protein
MVNKSPAKKPDCSLLTSLNMFAISIVSCFVARFERCFFREFKLDAMKLIR